MPELRDDLDRARDAEASAGRELDAVLREESSAYWKRTKGGKGYSAELYEHRRAAAQAAYDEARAETERLRGLYMVGTPFDLSEPKPEPEIDARAASRALFGG